MQTFLPNLLRKRKEKFDQKKRKIPISGGNNLSSKLEKQDARLKRHHRIRKKISGTKERPRLSVFKSLKHIYAQIINDEEGVTLVSACTLSPEIKEALHRATHLSVGEVERSEQIQHGGNITASKIVGEFLAKKALEKGIKNVVFDRGGYIYHGRVKALAEAAREAGLQF